MKVGKEYKLYPLGPPDGRFKPCIIRADDCANWKEANEVLREEYLKMRKFLSEADRNRYDKLLK